MGAVRDLLDVLASARGLRRRERWDAEAIRVWQLDRLRDLARFAREHSPFYRKLYSGIDLSGPFSPTDLPVVDKAAVMDHFDEVVTDPRLRLGEVRAFLGDEERAGCFAGEFRILSTAGTSGRRGLFVLGREEWIAVMASMLRWQRLIGLGPRLGRRVRVATVGAGNALHASRLLPLGVNVGLYEFRFLSVTDPMDSIVAALNDYQPDLLAPYASVAGLLALEQVEGRLSIHPRIVVTHSELLSDAVVRRVGAAWGIRPFNH
jgi:phenylacetate-CoA ligase